MYFEECVDLAMGPRARVPWGGRCMPQGRGVWHAALGGVQVGVDSGVRARGPLFQDSAGVKGKESRLGR